MILSLVRADVKIGANGPGHMFGKERPKGLPAHASNQFSGEVSLRDGVVPGAVAGGPPRSLGREERTCFDPIKQRFDRDRFLPSRKAGGVRHDVANEHALLAVGRKLGPILRDRGVDVDRPLSINIKTHKAVMVLVVDQMLNSESRCHSVVLLRR